MDKRLRNIMFIILGLIGLGMIARGVFFYFNQETFVYPYQYHMFGWMNGGWGMIGMGFVWVVVIGLVLYFVSPNFSSESSLSVLKKRLAKGEISKTEYDDLRNKLREN